MKKKYVIELDKEPSLVFIQGETGRDFTVYQDGKKVNGVRSITIRAAFDDVTTHEIEYVTGATKEK